MEALLLKIFSESWLIYLLFFMIVGGFIYKWVPYLLKKFDDVTVMFANTIKQLQETHREDMKILSDVFISQIKESNWNHLITHSNQAITHSKLEEIKTIVSKKK